MTKTLKPNTYEKYNIMMNTFGGMIRFYPYSRKITLAVNF